MESEVETRSICYISCGVDKNSQGSSEGFEKIFIDYTNLVACLCRVFYRSDYPMIEEDFENLKGIFCTCGEGLVNEEAVEKEAEIVEGVIALMGDSTEQLMEDFSILTCEASGIGVSGHKLPMPPTTGRWNRADPNTILRVLCHRNDKAANHFLIKKLSD
ncbi:hypothetical protein OIU79_004070 [Salix purpurea]|uniref:MHD2 domain-containing protein n=1 Tax=Salix purpurea TaxID=77065 RepID=A0A9Q0U9E7_SALPP|nr:hypothetical protein OIU79_004070 [Salix purpurea]